MQTDDKLQNGLSNVETENAETKTNPTDGWDDDDWSPDENISSKPVRVLQSTKQGKKLYFLFGFESKSLLRVYIYIVQCVSKVT